VSFMALSLSHSNGTCLKLIQKSLNVASIHRICAQQLPTAMYSASIVDNATLFCFLDDHETSDLPNSWNVPDVILIPTLHPAVDAKFCRFFRWSPRQHKRTWEICLAPVLDPYRRGVRGRASQFDHSTDKVSMIFVKHRRSAEKSADAGYQPDD